MGSVLEGVGFAVKGFFTGLGERLDPWLLLIHQPAGVTDGWFVCGVVNLVDLSISISNVSFTICCLNRSAGVLSAPYISEW